MRTLISYINEELIMEDEYVTSFWQHIDGFFGVVLGAIHFLLGLNYAVAKYLVETGVSVSSYIVSMGSSVVEVFQEFILLIAEVITEVIKGFLLIYYGISKTIEAFCTTFTDLVNFIQYIVQTIFDLAIDGLEFAGKSVASISQIPHQLFAAFVIFSEAFLNFWVWFLISSTTLIKELIWYPICAMAILAKFFATVALGIFQGLVNFIVGVYSVPWSVHLAILTIFLFFFISRKMSIFGVLRGILSITRILSKVFQRAGRFVSLRMAKFYNVQPGELRDDGIDFGPIGNQKGYCVICLTEPVEYVASPCSHACLCATCCRKFVLKTNRCPMCRDAVDSFTRVYVS